MSFIIRETKFEHIDTLTLQNQTDGTTAEIALKGATLLRYEILNRDSLFNIIDGFFDEIEFEAASGARSWIMIPFANRIPEGKYLFHGKEYKLNPIPPRTQVIHGFASYLNYEVIETSYDDNCAKAVFLLNKIRPGLYNGYPFSINIRISFILTSENLQIDVTAENIGDNPAPFGTGWHPYFRTNKEGIENLILTLNANKVIRLDQDYIPLPGLKAYADIEEYPGLNYNETVPVLNRIISNRKLDTCYEGLKKNNSGISECSLYDPDNGMQITMFQKSGVTLAFSGDSLSQRKRKSVALEPMQFITNAFNREEFADDISISPGDNKMFSFGVRVKFV